MKPFYQDDNCVIHNSDCLSLQSTKSKPKLILTDPPYATGKVQSRLGGESYADKESAEEVSDKIQTLCEKWFGADTTLAVILIIVWHTHLLKNLLSLVWFYVVKLFGHLD